MDAERRLYARFAEIGIGYELVEHEPTATVADSREVAAALAGERSKSLLLSDKDGRLVLATLRGEDRADLPQIARTAGLDGRLSFAPAKVMKEVLGVEPGHLSPFALINDPARRVGCTVIDERLLQANTIWAHPLRNTASVGISPKDLITFLELHAEKLAITGLAAA
jgi:Ala-tRNA(Pro) deacylase